MAKKGDYGASLARRTLAAAQRGENVPRDIQDAAKRVYGGVGGEGDVSALSKFWGIRRTGAGRLRGAARGLRMFGEAVADLSREASIIESMGGRASATDYARLSQAMLHHVERFTRTKGVKNIAERVVPLISSSPALASRLLNGIRAFARLGGAAAAAATIGIEAWQYHINSDKRGAQADARRIDRARAMGMSPSLSRELANRARLRYEANTGYLRQGWDYIFSGDKKEEIDADVKQQEELLSAYIKQGRAAHGAILAREAASMGGSLSDDEGRAALDAWAEGRRASLRNSVRADVERKLEHEFAFGASAWEDANRINRAGLGALGLVSTREEMMRARREKLYQEFEKAELEKWEKRKAEIEVMAKRMREGRTAAERLAHSREQAAARADFTSFASRHKVWNWG